MIRQRQTVTQFIDSVEENEFRDAGLFRLAIKESGSLFRYNLGPRSEGFVLCPVCGFSEPQVGSKADGKHKRLRVFSGARTCDKQPWKSISYGHEFQSYCLIARPTTVPASIESLAYAIQHGICRVIDVETYDIGVSWRWLGQKREDPLTEIILYDLTPGGAGFVKEALESWPDVLKASQTLCSECSCQTACYECLKTYSNQAYHDKLNRAKGKPGAPETLEVVRDRAAGGVKAASDPAVA